MSNIVNFIDTIINCKEKIIKTLHCETSQPYAPLKIRRIGAHSILYYYQPKILWFRVGERLTVTICRV